jgi:hypothetical protein
MHEEWTGRPVVASSSSMWSSQFVVGVGGDDDDHIYAGDGSGRSGS